jgi:hypothetical protein
MPSSRGNGFSVCGSGLVGALAMIYGGLAQGANLTPGQEQELRTRVLEQTGRLEALKRQMAEEEAKLAEIRQALGLDALDSLRGGTGTAAQAPSRNQPVGPVAQAPRPAASQASERPAQDNKTAAVAQIFEQPGILTPRGKLVVEPSFQYGYSSSNRVALVGYTIIPALHIGLIDVREVKRNTFTAALTGRYGITNRFEIEAKLPYVYRSDSVVARPWGVGGAQDQLLDSTGQGIGDFEVTGRYQLNDGGLDKPYYVGSLRFKSRTGKDPFEVESASGTFGPAQQGLQKELPTGSGFYTLQPGLTVLYPTDPAVFFGGINYQYNFSRSGLSFKLDDGTSVPVGEIKPGDVIGFNFGMGLSLNDRSSFSIGYDHASVGKLKQNGVTAPNSVRTQLGTLLLGYSQRINPTTSLNISLGMGVTRDTPDLTLTIRLPMTF